MMRGYSTTDAYKMGLVWGVAAALLAVILTRGFLPVVLVAVVAVLAFAAVIVAAYRVAGVAPSGDERTAAPASRPAAAPIAPAPKPAADAVSAPTASASEAMSNPTPAPAAPIAAPTETAPAFLTEAPAGGGDDLKRIKGIGPKLEVQLNGMGVYRFDQIAAWTPGEVAWVDGNLEGFKGRVSRDDWVGQARLLASGQTKKFAARVDSGDVPSSQG